MKNLQNMKIEELIETRNKLCDEFVHLGICPTKINKLCDLERELNLRVVIMKGE